MRERPILFSAPMVRALLAGTKTQTRRAVRIDDTPITKADLDANPMKYQRGIPGNATNVRMLGYLKCDAPVGSVTVSSRVHCPYWETGEGQLWVREAWRTVESLDGLRPIQLAESVPVRYEADGAERGKFRESTGRYRHARFMPRWASRISLEVTGVRVERLQDISGYDCAAEGIEIKPHLCGCEVCTMTSTLCTATETSLGLAYSELWRDINGAESWDANPFVWVLDFKRAEAAPRAA